MVKRLSLSVLALCLVLAAISAPANELSDAKGAAYKIKHDKFLPAKGKPVRDHAICVFSKDRAPADVAREQGLQNRVKMQWNVINAGHEASERARYLFSAVKARHETVGEACAVDGEFKSLDFGQPVEGGVTYTDIAAGDGADITYRRTPSASKAKFDAIKRDPPYTVDKANDTPLKYWGAPGVALFGFDGDDDLDIYVTNGPETHNSLYSNQLRETGEVTFVDVGAEAGVGAFDQDPVRVAPKIGFIICAPVSGSCFPRSHLPSTIQISAWRAT